jgi:hypothetical protein
LGGVWVETIQTLFLKKEWGFLLIAFELREEKPAVKM